MNSIITTTPVEIHDERMETIKECLNSGFIHGLSGKPYGAFPDLCIDTTIEQVREMSTTMLDSYLTERGSTVKRDNPLLYEALLNLDMYDLREYQRGLAVYMLSIKEDTAHVI